MILTQNKNYYGSQVHVPAASPGPSTVQFISAKVVDSTFFWSLIFYVSHRRRLLCLVDPKVLRTLRWRLLSHVIDTCD